MTQRNKSGKRFGPPPKKGPQSQGMKEGGSSQGERFVKFFGRQFNQNKDRVLQEAVTGLFKKDFGSRFKNLMNQAQRDFYAEEGISPYKMNFVAYNPKKEETGITSKETMGLKKGGTNQKKGMKKAFLGGMSNYLKINRFLDSVVYPTAFKVTLATQNEKRRKRAQKQKEEEKQKLSGYTPKKEETGITTKETMGLKKGGFGCPHRENGVKSDIKGISKIQVKGKKFIGVK
jgi:hypothetical protein|tara:strand:+ start:798 stop:1490 length:693 start_codon:yes stop_codon:yes gene_type:complete